MAWCLLSAVGGAPVAGAMPQRVVIDLNPGWLFFAGDIAGAQSVGFSDTGWERVCLPHTNTLVSHTNVDTSSFAFVSWYRRRFNPSLEDKGKRFILEFEAVSKAADVFVNGTPVGKHNGAYTPFSFDITDKMIMGSDNVLAVRVDSRQRRDIPPEGKNVDYLVFGGIVRDVSLTVVDPLHVDRVYIKRDTGAKTVLTVETVLANDGNAPRRCSVSTQLLDSMGRLVAERVAAQTIAANTRKAFTCKVGPVTMPRQWHPDSPYLYTVRTLVADSGRRLDAHHTRFGIRTFAFSGTGVFSVNGQPLKLRGLNRHETFPFIGRAAANRLQARDADIIKYDFGCNMVRCSHYPQDPAFLDRCDEIGLLVLEEMAGWIYVDRDSAWQATALLNLEAMILRDRNHASIVSFGVRINQSPDVHEFYKATNRIARELDPSRPTHGARVIHRGSKHEFMEGIWAQNFEIPDSTPPMLPWITTESVGHRFPAHSWDSMPRLLAHALLHAAVHDSCGANAAIAGLIGWCAFDYNSVYRYADRSVCYHGVADLFRQPKPAAFVYGSQRDPARYGPMVALLHDWCAAMSPNDVWVAGNCDSVELFVNGVSRGRRAPDRYRSLPHPLFVWKAIPFKRGEIKAAGIIGNSVVVWDIRKTPGAPVRLIVVPEDTVLICGGDMTRVLVTAADKNGQPVPRVSNPVFITVAGAADFLGRSPIALENGRTAFFVKTRAHDTGTVRCAVKSAGMKSKEIKITVVTAAAVPEE
jgi:beta-galactosidase